MQMHPEILAEVARQRQAQLLAEARTSRAGKAMRSNEPFLGRWLARLHRAPKETTTEQGEIGWTFT